MKYEHEGELSSRLGLYQDFQWFQIVVNVQTIFGKEDCIVTLSIYNERDEGSTVRIGEFSTY